MSQPPQFPAAAYPPPAGQRSPQKSKRPQTLIGTLVALVLLAGAAAATFKFTGDGRHATPQRPVTAAASPSTTTTTTTPSPSAAASTAAAPRQLEATNLRPLLLNAAEVNSAMNATEMVAKLDWLLETPPYISATPTPCAVAVMPGTKNAYWSNPSSTGYLMQHTHEDVPKPEHDVFQAIVLFHDDQEALAVLNKQKDLHLSKCNDTSATIRIGDGSHDEVQFGPLKQVGDTLTLSVRGVAPNTFKCQRAVTVQKNAIIDVRACNRQSIPTNEAVSIAQSVQRKISSQ